MKKLDFKIEVFLGEDDDEMNQPDYDVAIESDMIYGHVISNLLTEYKTKEVTDEQYEVLHSIWSKEFVDAQLEDMGPDFHKIYDDLSKPAIAKVVELYHKYGYPSEHIELMLRHIYASVEPRFKDIGYFFNDDVDNANKDLEILESDATVITPRAFSHCTKLKEVHLPNVKEIGEFAFSGCLSLRTVELSPKVKTIDDYAFNECHFLKDINLPESLEKIGERAFYACCHLNPEIVIPSDVPFIGEDVFDYTPLFAQYEQEIFEVSR